jgi:hypothetical protein
VKVTGFRKEFRVLIEEALDAGFEVRPKAQGVMLVHEKGSVMLHRTPSDRRSLQNTRALVRRVQNQ